MNSAPIQIGDEVLVRGKVVGIVRGICIVQPVLDEPPGPREDLSLRLDPSCHVENWKYLGNWPQPSWSAAVAQDLRSAPSVLPVPTPEPLIIDGTPFIDGEQAAAVLVARAHLAFRFLVQDGVNIGQRTAEGFLQMQSDAILQPHVDELAMLELERGAIDLAP